MYNVEDILAKLNKGETADSIAQSFADTLNAALEAQKVERAKSEKVNRMRTIISIVLDYVNDFYPEVREITTDIDLSDDATINDLIEEFDATMSILCKTIAAFQTKESVNPTVEKDNNFSLAIDKFFKEFNL